MKGNVPGFAVSVVKDDSLLYQHSFGEADIQNGKAYTNKTTQPIGSISKTFVGAAIVKAIEQGYFSLDTDINDILPFTIQNPKLPNAIIQVKHLVTHTSGLLDNPETYFKAYHILPGENLSTEGAQLMIDGLGIQQRETIALQEFLAEYYLPDGDHYSLGNFAQTTPGTAWNYSNIATSLTAFLIESATKIPFKDYVKTNLLDPLNMNQTAYGLAELSPNNIAKLYWDKTTPLPNYANDSYPDGSIHTSNEDLAKYLIDIMKGLRGQSTALFSNTAYQMLFNSLLPEGVVPSGLAENQGVFWFLDGSEIEHSGSDPGTTCSLQFDKSKNAGYLLLTNMDASTEEHEKAFFELAENVDKAITEFFKNY
ncbi:serine hydrolase domain-containing protein [Algoriphagus formosus]|uniref:serine hydrolase domain-containing protein n=1 Tax=Algoriphagus formosus TaxID=2007308 RepID=UPI0012FE1527|nr:serine hydrolase domain-containing protein [Algoriphagus formosus]